VLGKNSLHEALSIKLRLFIRTGADLFTDVLIAVGCCCIYRNEGEPCSVLAVSHSLSFLQPNSTPLKDMTAELHNVGNSRPHVVVLLLISHVSWFYLQLRIIALTVFFLELCLCWKCVMTDT